MNERATSRVLVWDLPTRFLHWLLAASFVGAFALAHVFEHRPGFVVHMLLGGIAAVVVLLRAVWGLVGSRHARFTSFPLSPGAVARYLREAVTGRGGGGPHAGHNPANAWVSLGLLAGTLGVAISGAMIGRGGHAAKEVHEALVVATLALAGAHLAGLVLHTVRRRENVALGMLDGKKAAPAAEAIPSSHPLVALAVVGVVGAAAVGFVRGYDPAARQVAIFGQTLDLGGKEKARGDGERKERRHKGERHHDDD
jgi:cytochrome b